MTCKGPRIAKRCHARGYPRGRTSRPSCFTPVCDGNTGQSRRRWRGSAGGRTGWLHERSSCAPACRRTEIDRAMRKGALIRQHRGVYRVGHAAPSVEASFIAAVKACGEGRGSQRTPGRLPARAAERPSANMPEVTTPTERRVRGIKTRRCRRIDRRDVITFRGIPVTSVPRTLVDLAAVLTDEELGESLPRGRSSLPHHAAASRGGPRSLAERRARAS